MNTLGTVARRRSGGLWFILAAGAALLALAACDEPVALLDDEQEEEPGPFVLSDPAAGALSAAAGAPRSAGAGAQANVVYVSLPASTVTDGKLATITHRGTGAVARTAMTDGGFDPVPILAGLGDTVAVEIQRAGSTTPLLFTYSVPRTRRPIVIRIDPPPKKRDVPLNARVRIVFSEPLDPRSITAASIRLERAGSAVSGRTTLSADGLRVEFVPDQQLAANTEYTLVLTSALTDLTGDALEQPVTVGFTTGMTSALAMVYTDGAALFRVDPGGNPIGEGDYRTFEFSATLHDDGQVTGSYDGFNPNNPQGLGFSGPVTCFTIVEGNVAWVAGGSGVEVGWLAVDHGPPGSTKPDQLSLVARLDIWGPGNGTAEDFCATTTATAGLGFSLKDLEQGDIVVQPVVGASATQLTFTMHPTNTPVGATIAPAVRVTARDAAGNTVVGFTGTVTLGIRSDTGQVTPVLSGTTTVAAVGGVATFSDLSLDRSGTGYTLVAQAPGLSSTTSVPFDVLSMTPGWIAFSRTVSGAPEENGIYIVRSDRSGLVRLTTGADGYPTWSPDGASIAFQRGDNGLYLLTVGESDATSLGNGRRPAWSPDGSSIAFLSDHEQAGQLDVYVMTADGLNVSRLTSGGVSGRAAWSPDGTKIAFPSGRDGSPNLYVANAEATEVIRLTSFDPCIVAGEPAWSPDGTKIAFPITVATDQQGRPLAECWSDVQGLYTVNADGSGLTRLTSTLQFDAAPSWSSDGSQIVVEGVHDSIGACQAAIWVANADGSGLTRLTHDLVGCNRTPGWAPAGSP